MWTEINDHITLPSHRDRRFLHFRLPLHSRQLLRYHYRSPGPPHPLAPFSMLRPFVGDVLPFPVPFS